MSKTGVVSGMAVILSVLVLAVPPAGAGNRKMIEQRIAALDQVNRQVVGRLPGLPRDGQVTFRGRGFPDGTVSGPAGGRTGATVSPPPVDDGEMIALSDAIGRHRRQPIRMEAYRDANADRARASPAARASARWSGWERMSSGPSRPR